MRDLFSVVLGGLIVFLVMNAQSDNFENPVLDDSLTIDLIDSLQNDSFDLSRVMICQPELAPQYAELSQVSWKLVKADTTYYAFEIEQGNEWFINQFHECARQFEEIIRKKNPKYRLIYSKDFVNAGMRVAFNPGGTYSYLGSINYDYRQGQHNMNIGWNEETGYRWTWLFSKGGVPERVKRWVHRHIHHEIGHHYGVMHHQNMEEAPEYFKDEILKDNPTWTEETFENSYKRFPQSIWLNYPFDIHSLMLYYSPINQYDTTAYGVITYNEIFSSQDTSMLWDVIIPESSLVVDEPKEPEPHVKGETVLYVYHSGRLLPGIVSNITYGKNKQNEIVPTYSVKPYFQKLTKHGYRDRVLKPSEVEGWANARKKELDSSESSYVDPEQDEIDRLNLILRSLE